MNSKLIEFFATILDVDCMLQTVYYSPIKVTRNSPAEGPTFDPPELNGIAFGPLFIKPEDINTELKEKLEAEIERLNWDELVFEEIRKLEENKHSEYWKEEV